MRALIVTLVTGALCVSTGIANRVASHVHAPSTRHFRHVPNRSCYRLQVAQPSMRGGQPNQSPDLIVGRQAA